MSSNPSARRLFATHPSSGPLLDGLIALAAIAGSLQLARHGGIGPSSPSRDLDPLGVALVACSTAPLIAWRRFPLGVFAVTAASGVVAAGLGYRIDLLLGPAIALYLLAASREPSAPWTRTATVIVVGMGLAFLGASAFARETLPGSELLHTGLAWGLAWFAGERTRLRLEQQREQIVELKERARRAEREAERERLLSAAEERARIARDLHDSAGHAISVIAVRAGAARLRHDEDPDRSRAALEAIEELARQTVEEIDQIVGTLREGPATNGVVEAPLGLASLDTLIERHRSAGLAVTVEASGTRRPLAAGPDQAAFRILQEALTNAARHGTGRAKIELTYGGDAVELTVTNPVLNGGSARPVGGHGLIGMRERATLLGGSLEARRANGAFRVLARIPYGGQRT